MKHNVAGPIAGLAADDLLPPRATRALFWRPRLLRDAPWTPHIPFAFWLVETCRPARVVELGLGAGVSYFAFCQAVDKLGLEARCAGIDHWRGDRFSAADPDTGAGARAHNDELYQDFSDCMAADLIGAETRFPDEAIDLLHVDVELTAAVVDSLLHDWARKLSRRAVVLLHGAGARGDTPEAAAFLAKIRGRHPTFELEAGEGLTLALIGTEQPERLLRLAALDPGSAEHRAARTAFQALGRGHRFEAASRRAGAAAAALRAELARAEAGRTALAAELGVHRAALEAQTRLAAAAQARLYDLDAARADRDGAAAELAATLAARDAALDDLRGTLAGRDAEAEAERAARGAAVDRLSAEVAELRAARDHAAAETAVMEDGLREARAALAGTRERIGDLEAEAGAGAEALAARFAELAALGGIAERTRVEAEAAAEAARERARRQDHEARELKAALAAAKAEAEAASAARRKAEAAAEAAVAAAVAAARAETEGAVAAVRRVAEAAAEAARHKAEVGLTAAEARRAKAEAAAAAERGERAKLQAEFARVLRYGQDLEKRHIAMLESETWRAMEPARRLVRLFKGGRPPSVFAPQLDRVRPAAAPATATGPAGGGAGGGGGGGEGGKPETRERTARAFEKAKAGFREAGRAELAATRARKSLDPANRRQVERALVLLGAEAPAEAERAAALKALEAMPAWRGDARGPGEAATLRLALLDGLGRADAADRFAEAPPPGAGAHPDFLLLAAGRARNDDGGGDARVAAVSRAFQAAAGLEIAVADADAPAGIDNLRGAGPLEKVGGAMKISVIVPAYNCADTIETSLRSISRQTWKNLEILVADDASTDATPEIVAAMAARDKRIRLIRLPANAGAYPARNAALAAAQGDLVTCQDADDWSHPERLRRQAEHLKANPHLTANVSHWARATPDLRFERRPFTAKVIHFNSSSIMFHRTRVLERAGFWDSVRFGADTEFWHRLQAVFGEAAVEELPELLAIGRIREGSLSRASASAYLGAKTGARKAYEHAWRQWHASAPASALRLAFPLERRPFGVPAVMTTGRSTRGHFDAVLVSDFRHMGGTTASNQQELVAQSRAGLRTALVQVDRYDFNVSRGVHPDIQALIDDGAVEQLVHGDEVTADVAVVRFPPIFSQRQDYLPVIRPKAVRVVVNQPPRRVAGEAPFYAIAACKANIAAYLGQEGDWVPIGPAVRAALEADGEAHHLTPEDWFNIIDVDAWRVARDGWCAERPVIGRHGRDAPEKWLTRQADLLGAYPDDGSVTVRVMGGADVALRTIGRRPAAWEVLEFNAMAPRDFLATLDFFVFFPHEGRIEAFGRTVIEAMASGALAILPRAFEPLFGPAAVYATPAEVGSVVARFYADRGAYLAQTARAEAEVRARFGFEQHVARLARAAGTIPAGIAAEIPAEIPAETAGAPA